MGRMGGSHFLQNQAAALPTASFQLPCAATALTCALAAGCCSSGRRAPRQCSPTGRGRKGWHTASATGGK